MKQRDAPPKKRILWPLRALLLLLPILLSGAAWKVHQLQQPISVGYGPEDIQSHVLSERMATEATLHPYAIGISVFWSKPWPKESGLDLMFYENLELNRHEGTLTYGTDNYGWTYSHVERQGIKLLSQTNLPPYPITLPSTVDSELRRLGWTLTEHYLP